MWRYVCDRIGYPSPPEPVFGNSGRVPITRDRRPKLLSQTGRTKKPFLLLLRVRRKAAKPVSCQAGAAKSSARCRPFQPAARVMALGFFQPSRARYPACLPGSQDRMRGESVRDGKRGSSRLGRHPFSFRGGGALFGARGGPRSLLICPRPKGDGGTTTEWGAFAAGFVLRLWACPTPAARLVDE
jgi:hypothetical protein